MALKVCLEHIKSSEKPKVIFLAPNGSLVDQQYEKFKGYDLLHFFCLIKLFYLSEKNFSV